MKIARPAGIFTITLSIIIGCIGKLVPHLFLSLPFPISVMLWVGTGNDMPPFFMKDAWKEDEIDSWTKDGDLIVATGVKSGTNFMLYCTHQIRTRGTDVNDDLFPDPNLATPFIDLRHSRAGSWAGDQKERYNTTVWRDGRLLKDIWDNEAYPFRIFKSHFAPPDLPVRKKGGKKLKYLVMVRNGLDVAASMTKFYSAHTDAYRNLWGGIPPNIPPQFSTGGSHPAVEDLLPGGHFDHLYFGYVNRWWPYRNDPNVLFLHYSDVRKDLRSHVKLIADFLDVKLTRGELSKVTQRCSIDHMKTIPDKFNFYMPLNTDVGLWDAHRDSVLYEGELIGGGEVGTGITKFNDEIVARWRKAEEEEFGHDAALLGWARNGGSFPPVER